MNFSQIYELSDALRLPVDPVEIARALGIKVVGYKAAAEHFDMNIRDLYLRCPLGFSFKEGKDLCIALNENACSEQRRRFTAAHELAHCLLGHLEHLGHLDRGTFSKRWERGADRFAAELLAPLAVLRNCGISSAADIMRLCGISKEAAVNRMYELAERERNGFRPTEDELRTAELFREFTDSVFEPPKTGYRKNLYISIH